MAAPRVRADQLLVERGLLGSRSLAQTAIAGGLVRADGAVVARASQRLPMDCRLEAAPPHPYVSRGGVKLAAALDHFGIAVAGALALDVGASTGGFTEVLLARGAARVVAVDSGRGQLHPRLRDDPRVLNLENTDIRSLPRTAMPEAPGVVVVDVSFIGLGAVLPAVSTLAAAEAVLVALVKPQFEVGREHIGKRGIVRDAAAAEAAVARSAETLTGLGWTVLGHRESPITGGDGNREWLLAARRP